MEQLGPLIVSKQLTNQSIEKFRLAARGIIYDKGKVLLIYSKFYNDYTFPGGGVESDEDVELALVRECREEAGVNIKAIRPYYCIFEKRELDENMYMLQESQFFFCDIDSVCPTHLEDYEVALGYQAVWLSIDDAIKRDEAKRKVLSISDYDGVLERELRILYQLKQDNY